MKIQEVWYIDDKDMPEVLTRKHNEEFKTQYVKLSRIEKGDFSNLESIEIKKMLELVKRE